MNIQEEKLMVFLTRRERNLIGCAIEIAINSPKQVNAILAKAAGTKEEKATLPVTNAFLKELEEYYNEKFQYI